MGNRFTYAGAELMLLTCGTCGAHHAIPASKWDACEEEGGFWTCPNGHSRGFREGKHEREALRRERDRLRQDNARLADKFSEARRAELEAVRGRLEVEKKLKAHRRRSAAGTCPCCKRTFSNMATHMRKQHPDYMAASGIKLATAAGG